MTIGVLALQGGFQAHIDMLTRLHEASKPIRNPHELKACEGLIIPGGESSTILRLMGDQQAAWFDAIKTFAKQHWVFGTCAGMILLAKTVTPTQASLGLIDISVERNAYGRQRDSRIISLPYTFIDGHSDNIEVVFIRAPKIGSIGAGVACLLKEADTPLLVQQGARMAASFHPESALDNRLYADCLNHLRKAV
jgi:5'-phosphate synthase pdxT subunit